MSSILMLLLLLAGLATSALAQSRPVLTRIARARLVESDSFMLTRPGRMIAGPRDTWFVADQRDARIIEFSSSGQRLRVFGRRGSGPGELRAAASLAISGDTLLSAWDIGANRVVSWDLRSGRAAGGFLLSGWIPLMRYGPAALRVGVLDADSVTSVRELGPSGEVLRREGGRPAYFTKVPQMIRGFGSVLFDDVGGDTYAVFEVANSLFHWTRGTRTIDETPIPTGTRRGVKQELFDEVLRDPSRAAAIAYDRSIPLLLQHIGGQRLALVTMDGRLDNKMNFIGTMHLTLLDVARRRACVDIAIPARQEPLASFALAGDTLAVLQQDEDENGEPATFISTFTINDAACRWVPLPAAKR